MTATDYNRRRTVCLAVVALGLMAAAPAHADIASTIDSIRTTYLTNALFKAVGTIMIVVTALMWMFGRMEMMKMVMIVVAGAVITNAPQIAGTLFGG